MGTRALRGNPRVLVAVIVSAAALVATPPALGAAGAATNSSLDDAPTAAVAIPVAEADGHDGPLFDPAAKAMEPDPEEPTVIVAVGDTGVNPYHEAYHRPNLTVHPCEWVAGFDDCSIPALELSIGEYDTYEEAYAADLATWRSLEVGQWYWIPKTNIIGAVCDGSTNIAGTPPPVSPDAPCIHDEHGHGTGTTSSVISEAPNALLLVHEGNSGNSALATAPVVPDIQSHSWGPAAPLPLHAADPVGLGLADRGTFDAETIFFIAAGNEAPFPTILDGSRVHPSVQIVGGGFPGKATARSWSTFDYASWFCRPTALHTSTTDVRPSYCGTSFSAPTAAGTAAAALLEVRRAEGYLGRSTRDMVTGEVSREAFIAALRAGATYDVAEARFTGQEGTVSTAFAMPAGTEPMWWGYGWLDATRVDEVVACAADGVCAGTSEVAQAWNEARQEARRRQTEPVIGAVVDEHVAQDDAGSGRDAGATFHSAVAVERGVEHTAGLFPQGRGLIPTEDNDWFTFTGTAGEDVTVSRIPADEVDRWASLNCIRVHAADGTQVGNTSCGETLTVTLPADGTYAAEFGYFLVVPSPYTFTIS